MSCGKIDLECTFCRLSKGRLNVVPGIGPCGSRIVFIGEAPGKDEDVKSEPFVGRAGKVFDDALERAGVKRKDVYITNLVKCRPPNNRRPRKDEIATCGIFLDSELKTIKPDIVCALGQTVANSLLGNKEQMSSLVRNERSVRIGGRETRLLVAFHPAACLYQRKNLKAFRKGVAAALEAAGMSTKHTSRR